MFNSYLISIKSTSVYADNFMLLQKANNLNIKLLKHWLSAVGLFTLHNYCLPR